MVYPPSPGPRAAGKRHGYFFGGIHATGGSCSLPRLQRGHRYRAMITLTGMRAAYVEFDVPLAGPAQITLPPVAIEWDPSFDQR